MRDNKTKNMVLCGMFVALITAGAFLKIPIPGLPISMQNFFTQMAGLLLGAASGSISVVIYIILGLVGLPVFTSGGGVQYIFKPSFGYIAGFAIAALITGLIAHKDKEKYPSFKRLLLANAVGYIVIQVIGFFYYYLMSVFYLQNGTALIPLFYSICLTTIPGDIIKCVLGAVLAKRLIPLVLPLSSESFHEL